MNTFKRQQWIAFSAAVLLAAAPLANAHHGGGRNSDREYGKVTHVEPIVRYVEVSTPRQECWQEEVARTRPGSSDTAPVLMGGILGGVAGHQFGKGRGKDVATVAGALLGLHLGKEYHRENGRPAETTYGYENRCRTVNERHTEERIDGYRVTYTYAGQTYHTRMPHDPGKRIPLRVSVSPIR